MIEHWYIPVATVLQFQRICGIPETFEGPLFDSAAKKLDMLCREATYKQTRGDPPAQKWLVRMQLHGKSTRLELTVVTTPRPEGDAPQLVDVRNKDTRAK